MCINTDLTGVQPAVLEEAWPDGGGHLQWAEPDLSPAGGGA